MRLLISLSFIQISLVNWCTHKSEVRQCLLHSWSSAWQGLSVCFVGIITNLYFVVIVVCCLLESNIELFVCLFVCLCFGCSGLWSCCQSCAGADWSAKHYASRDLESWYHLHCNLCDVCLFVFVCVVCWFKIWMQDGIKCKMEEKNNNSRSKSNKSQTIISHSPFVWTYFSPQQQS